MHVMRLHRKLFVKLWKTLRNWYFLNPKKVTVQQYASVPAELHDKCNLEEISPELKCDVLDAFLICRPLQCGTDDRFRCDCNVYDHGWVPYWQIMGTKYKQSDITQRHSRKQNPIKLEKFYFEEVTEHHTMKQNSDKIHLRLLNIEGFDAAISILFSIYFNHMNLNWY